MTDRRVLLVDDDVDMLTTVAQLLELRGWSVETATDGRQALDAVGRGMPDLVLLDLKMPIMNGWQFAREYRARWGRRAAPIVVLSAVDDPARRAQEVGAVAWIAKPFEVAELFQVVAAHAPPR